MADAEDLIDPELLALPRYRLAEAALDRARALGVQHADFRLERNRVQRISVRDGQLLAGDGSLSVPVSKKAQSFTPGTPGDPFGSSSQADYPASQRCS